MFWATCNFHSERLLQVASTLAWLTPGWSNRLLLSVPLPSLEKTPLICSSALLGLVWQTVGLVAAELVEPGIGIHPPTLSSHLHFPSQCSRLTLSCKRQHNFTRGRRKASHRWIVPSGLQVDTAGKCQTGYIEHNEGLRIYADSLWPTGMTRLALVSQLHNGRHSHTVSVKHHTITHHHTTLKKF